MQGKLIIIEAGDGCGKATQTKLLYDRLVNDGENVYKVEFPDYDSDSSALIKMYLQGKFGQQAQAVNAYAASTFYAVDRYASFQIKWKARYDQGAIIIADRYTTSNMVHQAVKIADSQERQNYLAWLWDLEFVKLGLPIPDAVVFLEMPPELSAKLLAERAQTTNTAKDIHEQDQAYLTSCHMAYCELAGKYDWYTIHCSEAGLIKSRARINDEIYQIVKTII